jgi:2-oxoglutarate dehydrogenase E1 component
MTQKGYANVIDEVDPITLAQVRRVVFCSGKVYFDLLQARRSQHLNDVAVVRIEQLYPFPIDEYHSVLGRYASAADLVWCQEEPQNQGAWYQIRHRLEDVSGARPVYYAGRAAAAAPATGLAKLHEREQRSLVETALSATSIEQTLRSTPRLTLTPGAANGVSTPAAASADRPATAERSPGALRKSS